MEASNCHRRNEWSERFLSPTEFFCQAETQAIEIRRGIRQLPMARRASEPGFRDDVVQVSHLVEKLSRRGRTLPTAEAIELSEFVEILLDLLRQKVDGFLAS